jgi:ABC-type transport system substrate-binding protein
VLVVIVLLASIAAVNVQVHVQSYTPPAGWPEGPPYFTLWAVREWDSFPRYPCEDLWSILDPVFADIGIDLQIYLLGDMYDRWHLLWEAGLGGRPPGKPLGAWDLTEMEWRLNPQGMLGIDGLILSKNIPPYGNNIFPYLNMKSDELYWGMQTTVDPEARVAYAYAWQAEMMHNPPLVCMYYDYSYGMQASYVQGWEDSCWWYDVSTLRINYTGLEQYLSSTLRGRLDNGVIIDGVNEPWYFYLALFPDSDMDEMLVDLTGGSLYRVSVDPWPAEEEIADPTHYYMKPWLASDHHETPYEEEIPDPLETVDPELVYPVTVPLREGVQWSDGHLFDAQDVKYTYDLVINPNVLSSATMDFEPIIKRPEYMYKNGSIAWGKDVTDIGENWDPNSIALICHDKDYADLELILANMWGAGIVPYHVIKPIVDLVGPSKLRNHEIATDAQYVIDNLPAIGPFKYESYTSPMGYADMTLAKNEKFFGYNASLLKEEELINDGPWGPYGINKLIMRYISDPATLFTTVQTHEVDLAEYTSGTIEDFEAMMDDPTLRVKETVSQTGNFIWFNFNNPYLSNRYVRLAFAHLVPYERIINEILPGWGVTRTLPGISWITPWNVYAYPENGEVIGYSLFNKDLEPYEYDPVAASKYLDMWYYSQTGKNASIGGGKYEYDLGPVGDANFDGKVNLDDLFLLIDKWNDGLHPYEIDWWPPEGYIGELAYPWPVEEGASVAPGNDIDIDFDNDGKTADPDDFLLWLYNWGKEYPFSGAR